MSTPYENLVPALRNLQSMLMAVEQLLKQQRSERALIEQVIVRADHTKLKIHAEEKCHVRPHFHLEYKQQFNASYAMDDLSLLAGSIPKEYTGVIAEWVKGHRSDLQGYWRDVNDGKSVPVSSCSMHSVSSAEHPINLYRKSSSISYAFSDEST